MEQLKNRLSELREQLNAENHKEVLQKIKEVRAQIDTHKRTELLTRVNAKYNRLRDMARQAWECEQPTEDITNSDGSFHKTKVKKYPKIAALQYASASWKDGLLHEIRINGERFQMHATKHEYGKPTIYTRPATFEDFLTLNSLPHGEITLEQYEEMSAKLTALNQQLEDAIKSYSNGIDALNIHSFNYWGLVGQSNKHVYEYTPNV